MFHSCMIQLVLEQYCFVFGDSVETPKRDQSCSDSFCFSFRECLQQVLRLDHLKAVLKRCC